MSTCAELRALAKQAGLANFSKAKKAELIEMLTNASIATGTYKQAMEPVAKQESLTEEAKESTDRVFEKNKTETVPAPVAVKPPKKVRQQSKPSMWNTFLKEYRNEHGCSLKEAMSKKEEYAAYKAKNSTEVREE